VDARQDGLAVHEAAPDTLEAPDPGASAPQTTVPELVRERLEPLGQLAAAYIVCRAGDDLLLVDQHRAAERIIADELSGREVAVPRQMLVLPLTLELTDAERGVLEQWRPALAETGFEIEPFGTGAYLLRSVPAPLADRNPEEILRGVIEEIAQWGEADIAAWRERFTATLACHSAVKRGEHLSDQEMRRLIAALNEASAPGICPHGDPIIVRLSRDQLDKQFNR